MSRTKGPENARALFVSRIQSSVSTGVRVTVVERGDYVRDSVGGDLRTASGRNYVPVTPERSSRSRARCTRMAPATFTGTA